jgi:hypothetical protein
MSGNLLALPGTSYTTLLTATLASVDFRHSLELRVT